MGSKSYRFIVGGLLAVLAMVASFSGRAATDTWTDPTTNNQTGKSTHVTIYDAFQAN